MKPSPTYTIALIVSLGGFIFGFDASVISGAIGFVNTQFGLSDFQTGLVVSAPTLGATIAALFVGMISDQIGRKRVLQIIALLYLVSAITSALAIDFEMLVVARFVGGLAFASLMIAPMYIAEISPASLRGKLVSFNQFNIMIGFSAAYFSNYLLFKAGATEGGLVSSLGIDQYTWRWMLGLEILPAAFYFLALFKIPESPRWLVVNGFTEEARQIIVKLTPQADPDQEIQDIKQTTSEVREPLVQRLKQLIGPRMRFALTIGVIVGVAQQITGINAVYFYAPSIFEQSGVGSDAAFAQAISVGIINIIFTLIAMALIDKLGRKPLLIGGLTGVFVSMSVAAYGFYSATYQLTAQKVAHLADSINLASLQPMFDLVYQSDVAFKNALSAALGETTMKANESALLQAGGDMPATLILIGILGFVASFAISLGPVMWVLFSEIFPNKIRGLAISFVGVINSAVSFGVQFVFPWELNHLGASTTFLIYGLFALLGLALVTWLLPETKGKSLEQLEVDLCKKPLPAGQPAMGGVA